MVVYARLSAAVAIFGLALGFGHPWFALLLIAVVPK